MFNIARRTNVLLVEEGRVGQHGISMSQRHLIVNTMIESPEPVWHAGNWLSILHGTLTSIVTRTVLHDPLLTSLHGMTIGGLHCCGFDRHGPGNVPSVEMYDCKHVLPDYCKSLPRLFRLSSCKRRRNPTLYQWSNRWRSDVVEFVRPERMSEDPHCVF